MKYDLKGTKYDPWGNKAQAMQAYKKTGRQQCYWRPRCKGRVFSQFFFYPRIDEYRKRALKAWKTIRRKKKGGKRNA
jgi:hypothetical protein